MILRSAIRSPSECPTIVCARPATRAVLRAFLPLLALLPAIPVRAQENQGSAEPLTIARLSGTIRVDGVVEEPAWDAVEPLVMTMFSPLFRGELSERTEIRVAHDDSYLYVSGRMFDSDPEGIRTNTLYRDAYSGDDLVAVVVDSYDDYETAVWFTTNPAGVRTDRTVSGDAVFTGSGMPMNADWNAHWDVATSRDDLGWYAEFRIPFSTLGFQDQGGDVVMGLIAYRFIARKNERQVFPDIDPAWGGLGFAKPSQARRIVIHGVHETNPVYVTPYSLVGMNQSPVLQGPEGIGGHWGIESDPTTEVGGDLRFSPTSNLTLDLTANTDFAQVEADSQQINLTRFALFFPEKRQFFQERASTFQFGTGGFNNRLFHSRRIGLDDGEIVRIYGGARAVGRLGGLDFGFLDMQTASHDGRSSENMGVLRLNQQVLNPYSSVGGMLTSRLGSDGRDNIAYGLDAVIRPLGDEYVTLKWAQTFDEAIEEASALESGLVQVRWERQRDAGLSYAGEYVRVGRDYLPRLGFQNRTAYRYFGGSAQLKSFRGASSPLRSAALRVNTGHYIRTEDGTAESRQVAPELRIETKGAAEIELTWTASFESVRDSFDVSEVAVPPGEYWFHEAKARLQLPRTDLFRGALTATAGSFYGGRRLGLALDPAWNPSRYLELGAGYEVNRLTFPDRGLATTAHLARLKVQIAFDTRMSLSTFGQFSNDADLTSFNIRFRYNFREGTDLWIVYNEGLNTRRDIVDRPRLPLSAGRAIMIKYSHAFIW